MYLLAASHAEIGWVELERPHIGTFLWWRWLDVGRFEALAAGEVALVDS